MTKAYSSLNGTHPKDFKWSSYRYYAYGKRDPLLTSPKCYLRMGQTDLERQKEYRRMIQFIFETDKRVLQKCPYRKKNGQILLFIGDPVRVKVKYENIRETLRAKKKGSFVNKLQIKSDVIPAKAGIQS